MSESITLEYVDENRDIAVLTINRPRRRNALDASTLSELHTLVDDLNGRADFRALVITGAGTAFCSGADVKANADDRGVPTSPAAHLAASATSVVGTTYGAQELMASLFEKIHRMRQPVIAAVNGAAVGGGFALALACDIRIATEQAQFGAVFMRHGVSSCDMGTSYFLPRLVGASRSAELLLTGRVFGADEAHRIGLVHRVEDSARVIEGAVAKAVEIAAFSPLAVWMTKETMWQTCDSPSLRQALDIENRTQVLCSTTGDIDKSFTAFRDKGVWEWSPL
ncbi:enoyl-CoA hydratase/isomerase family protein [Mycobacterium sp. BMJ-28]